MNAAGDWIIIRALVNSTDADPGDAHSPVLLSQANQPGEANSACVTRIFYLTGVNASTYTVQIQYHMFDGDATGTVTDRTLNIIAFPK
jgi:hypothetical protein